MRPRLRPLVLVAAAWLSLDNVYYSYRNNDIIIETIPHGNTANIPVVSMVSPL